MKFRTEINITDAPKNLSPGRLVLLVGSCFSDNIGARMVSADWPAIVNPCGVIYNPASMAILFRLALQDESSRIREIRDSITKREGRFVSWLMGSTVSEITEDDCVENVAKCIAGIREALGAADALILTFGTSDIWELAESGKVVGNCHKHPAKEFRRRRLSMDEIVADWNEIFEKIRDINPDVKIILTVSPRRYLSDGFAENSRQKAVLLLACEILCRELDNIWYFPAYEILNDDLRDYRYYKADLLHPSEMAIDYIWEKFCDTFLDHLNREKLKMMEKEARRRRHRSII